MRKIQFKLEFKLGVVGHTYNLNIPGSGKMRRSLGPAWVTSQEGAESKEAAGDCALFNLKKSKPENTTKQTTNKGLKEPERLLQGEKRSPAYKSRDNLVKDNEIR